MPNTKLPPDVIDYWPEVFDHIEIKAVPLKYIVSVHVTFTDGKEWNIDIDESKKSSDTYIEETINTFFKEYNDVISKVDFKLDTPSLVNDVKSQTKTFMKRS